MEIYSWRRMTGRGSSVLATAITSWGSLSNVISVHFEISIRGTQYGQTLETITPSFASVGQIWMRFGVGNRAPWKAT